MATEKTNPLKLFNSLTIEDLEDRLAELVAEDKAIRTLLRSLKARERARRARRAKEEAQTA